ncbi:spore coat associated protein CotJA [Clostridioides difficile]|nr:spore coat associated protein CotJA [Clostridioides difficile]MCK3747950.1 spore coat associated protein CotJA [Clostridioides difficile]MCP8397540.1 spore coat associated protein CotJA [Clostridioides difficile]MCP8416527.1 spore coat associated protein CotJA [Clostridioides difficile]MCP8493301.1 spore coat associated protein CotJA [Clostridioides difficile]MCP8658505.1 spore coat associated protein CotJA [Clostridioides difficile]
MGYLKEDKQDYCCEFARPYINRQIYDDTYNPKTALKRGTLFPELDLIESNNYND